LSLIPLAGYGQQSSDIEIVGATKGVGGEKVEYCIGCHLTRAQFDHLFFLPEKYRASK
jgi:hypothetical protein